MGGPGSGRCYCGGAGGAGGKDTTEDHNKIDIRWLKKQGCLTPGTISALSWSTTYGSGETRQKGSIVYRMEADHMTLAYRYRAKEDKWQDVEQVVRFDRTPCNYGGSRTWFLCPEGVQRRVAMCFTAPGSTFFAGIAITFVIPVNRNLKTDRLMRRQRKIRKRLGASKNLTIPIWEKPKGMHWKNL